MPALVASEIRCGRRSAPWRIVERALDYTTARHHARPAQLALLVDLRPHRIARATPRHMQGRERDVRLRRRRPLRRGDRADHLALARPVVDVRRPSRLVAFDVQPHETIARAALLLLEQGAASVEIRL